MTIEHACMQVVRKPWGSTDLRPWSEIHDDGVAIGEIWYERADMGAPDPALLLKLLFTKEALSIQVHPDDAFAQSIGLTRGKTEAWYILSATPDAQIGVGLKRQVTATQLRAAIEDGSILDLVEWRPAVKGDVVFVPAGTIHAIGSGLVIAEIQQRSDATFRLFDHGRQRELHVENGVGVAHLGPADRSPVPTRFTNARTLLMTCPYFVLERIDLPADSFWDLHAQKETWLLVLEGHAKIGLVNTFVGEAVYADDDSARISVGSQGMKGLLAYPSGEPDAELLQARFPTHRFSRPPFLHWAKAAPPIRS